MRIHRDLRAKALSLWLSAAVAAAVVAPPPAHAEPSALEKETARTLMAEGRDKRDAGDHKGALKAFQAAHGIMNLPTTGLEVGRSQVDVGLLVEARDTLLAVSRMPVTPGEPAAFALARKQAVERSDDLVDRIPSLRITLQGVAEGAPVTVTIDGAPVAAAALMVPVKVNPGTHVIVARLGDAEKQESITVKEGEKKELTIVVPKPTAPVEPVASAAPAASASAPPVATAPPPPAATTPRPTPPPAPEKPVSRTSPLVYAGFVTAGVGLLVGGVAGAIELSKASDIKSQCDGTRCPRSVQDDLDGARTLATVSTIGFIVAGVGAGIGIVGLFSSGPSPASDRGSVGLSVGLGSVSLRGSF
ncbi:MAG: hypothetical protein HYV09_16750 [Deltaproteobacteria bacterium]|nr:hypothetical protein [Deltaproteobacteria bacterium]